jgi:hypothetical protein
MSRSEPPTYAFALFQVAEANIARAKTAGDGMRPIVMHWDCTTFAYDTVEKGVMGLIHFSRTDENGKATTISLTADKVYCLQVRHIPVVKTAA